jgi:hypothetical protein
MMRAGGLSGGPWISEMVRNFLVATVWILATGPASAEWRSIRDEVAGFQIPIPSGYELTLQPKGGASRLFHNQDGDILAVWSSRLPEDGLRAEMNKRRAEDEAKGWRISYERATAEWASYSGILNDQIRYVRGIKYCGGRAAFFLIDYQQENKAHYDSIVTHMVRNLRALDC